MRILALETSAKAVSAAVTEDGKIAIDASNFEIVTLRLVK